MIVPDSDIDTIGLHRAALDDLVDSAERALRVGDIDAAVRLASVAADFASRQHPGLFADVRLERVLGYAGDRLPQPTSESNLGTVVHVMDADPRSGVVDTVDRLSAAVSMTSLTYTTNTADPLASAQRLRQVASHGDLVMIHTAPDDVVASLAFGRWPGRPPVVHVNHHDTVFWVGVGIADMVVSHRAVGSALAVDRRCVGPGRTGVLPGTRASSAVWAEWTGQLITKASTVHRAWLPEALLPLPISARDVEVFQSLEAARRSDGLRGSWQRRGPQVAAPYRPELSVVILGTDLGETLECLDEAYEALGGTLAQVIIANVGGGPDFGATMADLAGVVTTLGYDPADSPIEAAQRAVRWCAADRTAIVADEMRLDRDDLFGALARLDTATAPIELASRGYSAGLGCCVARTDDLVGWLGLASVSGVEFSKKSRSVDLVTP